ncbi:MAG: TolC family protein [Gemmatimonadetes bacterium]|nr:TolC family protein [Gemmatimonadota bacterium]
MDTAVKVALLLNRTLSATLEEVGLAQADLRQARLIANPAVSVERLASGAGSVQLAGVVLPLVDALQRPLRTRVSESALRAAEQRVADAVIDLAKRVRVAYVMTQAATQMVELWATVGAATAASATGARVLHAAGNLSDLVLAQEQAMAAQAQLSLIRAREEQQVTRAELARLMGVDATDTTWTVTSRLADPEDAGATARDIVRIALRRRLDLRARRQDVETRARALGLTQRFALLADGTIGMSYEREPDGAFRGGGFSLPIPLFDRGQARVARDRALLRQAVALHDAAVVDVSAEVTVLVARMAGARSRAIQLRTEVLPARRLVVSETQRFVNAMQETIFTLLLARQTEIEAGQAYVEALSEYWTTRAELERASGGSLAPLNEAERGEPEERQTTRSRP